MLTSSEKDELRKIISISLDKAEKQWQEGGHLLKANREIAMESKHKSMMDSAEPSKIPGHEIVRDDETVIDEFVAFVADMRDSSKHLMCAISRKHADVSGLQRVYYETSALLPALAYAVNKEKGSVTEYLGDGILALFRIDSDAREQAIYASHRAAKNAIGDVRQIVNEALFERYRLPAVDIGGERGKTNKCLRDAAIVGVLAGCGLRREEIAGLTFDDLDSVNSMFLVRGKGNKERETPIPPTTMERINRWLVIRGNEEGPLFVRVHRSGAISSRMSGLSGQAIYNILRGRCEEVKYESINPHAMRHYFATNLLRNGVDIKTVMEMLGHESITTTQSYIDKNKEEERKAAIIADI